MKQHGHTQAIHSLPHDAADAVEYYNGRPISYPLGDFVFDHYSRKTSEAFILDASLRPSSGGDVTVTPVHLNASGRTEQAYDAEAATILQRLHDISIERGTTVMIEVDLARVTP